MGHLFISLFYLCCCFFILCFGEFFRRNSKRRNNHVKELSGNIIPMETGILQESNQEILTDGDLLAEGIYDDTVVLTKENFLSYVQQVKMKADPFSNEFSSLDKHSPHQKATHNAANAAATSIRQSQETTAEKTTRNTAKAVATSIQQSQESMAEKTAHHAADATATSAVRASESFAQKRTRQQCNAISTSAARAVEGSTERLQRLQTVNQHQHAQQGLCSPLKQQMPTWALFLRTIQARTIILAGISQNVHTTCNVHRQSMIHARKDTRRDDICSMHLNQFMLFNSSPKFGMASPKVVFFSTQDELTTPQHCRVDPLSSASADNALYSSTDIQGSTGPRTSLFHSAYLQAVAFET
ncbi:unnamed protein product [Acanthosepion pharaonis]|uniref:Uncharacterized protein n=1 Tax=Acanthosepion pharaonis TaxID=158019 RepID=A0A812CWT8_ACAPH|nr:unnamed protein product [Sepia pharaonis]